MKLLITEVIWPEGIQNLEEAGYQVDYNKELWKDREELLKCISEYDGLIVRNQTQVDKELLHAAPHLKVIGRLGVGLDNIDLDSAKDNNVKVVAAKNANATSVAEYVLSAMLDFSRTLSSANQDVRKGNWNRSFFTGQELKGKTLGLVGMGEISHRVAKRAKAFDMKIVGYDPYVTNYDNITDETGVEKVSDLSTLLNKSHFVSIHVPYNSHTKYLINENSLKEMKKESIIINTSRGGIVDEKALAEAIEKNIIAGAYLDVLEKEPITENSPLFTDSNVVITPHIAGLTEESQVRTSVLVAEEVNKILKGERSLCVV